MLSRKEAPPDMNRHKYRMLSLKNVTDDGRILLAEVEDYYAAEALKCEFFTRDGDVLVRLSTPYSIVLIAEEEAGVLISSHFAIIRTAKAIDPRYLHWWLTKNRKRFYQMASGSTMMGTISSGYIADMTFDPPPLERQRQVATLLKMKNREQHLLSLLSEKKKKLIDATIKKITKKENPL